MDRDGGVHVAPLQLGEIIEVMPGVTQVARITKSWKHASREFKPTNTIVKVGDTDVATFTDMAAAIRSAHGPVPIVYERDGQRFTTTVDVAQTQRFTSADAAAPATVGNRAANPAVPSWREVRAARR